MKRNFDQITKLGCSTIQHGKWNNRIYLMKLHPEDCPEIIFRLDRMAREKGYDKILAKISSRLASPFFENGYHREASIPDFFAWDDTCFFLSRFFHENRKSELHPNEIERVVSNLERIQTRPERFSQSALFRIQVCSARDSQEISNLYRQVFQSYPFPIHDPGYIEKTMQTHVVYYGVRNQDRLIALSSAEMDLESANVEMTDFAVHPRWRKKGLAKLLLAKMESDMKERKVRMAYTIARLLSTSMSAVFKQMGYRFAGILTNNTQIAGRIETMGVWYKHLLHKKKLDTGNNLF